MHDTVTHIPSQDLWIFNPKSGPKMLGEYSYVHVTQSDATRYYMFEHEPPFYSRREVRLNIMVELILTPLEYIEFMDGHLHQSKIYLWNKHLPPRYWYIEWPRTTWRNNGTTWTIRLQLMEIRNA